MCVVPLFVWLTRRGREGFAARSRLSSSAVWPDPVLRWSRSPPVGCPGIMLGKTMGRGGTSPNRFTGESQGIADLEVRSRNGRSLGDVHRFSD